MKRETHDVDHVMLLGAAGTDRPRRFTEKGMGREYVHAVPAAPNAAADAVRTQRHMAITKCEPSVPTRRRPSTGSASAHHRVYGSPRSSRSPIFSFLYRDNPFYKVAESVLVGVSAAYWMVVGFWDVIVPNLIGKISPAIVQAWAMPGLSGPGSRARPLVHHPAACSV